MPMKPREMEKLILADGWLFKEQNGPHKLFFYRHQHYTEYTNGVVPFGLEFYRQRLILMHGSFHFWTK